MRDIPDEWVNNPTLTEFCFSAFVVDRKGEGAFELYFFFETDKLWGGAEATSNYIYQILLKVSLDYSD